MQELIDLRNAYKIYGEGLESEVRALNGVNLKVSPGEFVAIVGASGSGKSTMMNILGCLDIPTYGEYYLGGELVSELPDKKLSRIRNRQIGFIFQGFNLIPALNAIENVELPLIYQGIHGTKRREMAIEALERVGLEQRQNHRPAEMSGGQQQRVAIARAIAAHPSILMADEPTGNLDSRTGEHVMKIINQLHEEGVTIILITHDMSMASVAWRTVQMKDGIIIEDKVLRQAVRA